MVFDGGRESMSFEVLQGRDLAAWDEPADTADQRQFLEEWLHYQRHEFLRKLRDLTPEGLVAWSVPPLEVSVMGLVRHMTQMEHAAFSWGLSGGDRREIYGEDDYHGATVEELDHDLALYFVEVDTADRAIASQLNITSMGIGHGRPLGAVLVKMIDEYALHAGQAHMLRFAALGELIR